MKRFCCRKFIYISLKIGFFSIEVMKNLFYVIVITNDYNFIQIKFVILLITIVLIR